MGNKSFSLASGMYYNHLLLKHIPINNKPASTFQTHWFMLCSMYPCRSSTNNSRLQAQSSCYATLKSRKSHCTMTQPRNSNATGKSSVPRRSNQLRNNAPHAQCCTNVIIPMQKQSMPTSAILQSQIWYIGPEQFLQVLEDIWHVTDD